MPGHGRLADEADVVEYRDMVTIVRDRIQDSDPRGLTLDQVKAARPTLDYDGRYGSADAFSKPFFAVYNNSSGLEACQTADPKIRRAAGPTYVALLPRRCRRVVENRFRRSCLPEPPARSPQTSSRRC